MSFLLHHIDNHEYSTHIYIWCIFVSTNYARTPRHIAMLAGNGGYQRSSIVCQLKLIWMSIQSLGGRAFVYYLTQWYIRRSCYLVCLLHVWVYHIWNMPGDVRIEDRWWCVIQATWWGLSGWSSRINFVEDVFSWIIVSNLKHFIVLFILWHKVVYIICFELLFKLKRNICVTFLFRAIAFCWLFS